MTILIQFDLGEQPAQATHGMCGTIAHPELSPLHNNPRPPNHHAGDMSKWRNPQSNTLASPNVLIGPCK